MWPTMDEYDLIAIGSGPAGEKGAATAAAFGKRVALIERERVVGGVSTNTGTLPSKTLRETALALSGFRSRQLFGVDLSLRREATVADLMHHERRVVSSERGRVLDVVYKTGIDLFRGNASFVDPHTVRISRASGDSVTIRAGIILIGTGSSPVHPPGFAFADPRILDSDEILTMHRLPASMAVVGAGVIGAEYACTFAELGCHVEVIDGRGALLPFLDKELSTALEAAMLKLGIVFHWNESVVRCGQDAPGPVILTCASGKEVIADAVLVAAGRASNTDALNLPAAGVATGLKGVIPVDKHYRTSVEHIYAAGDVIGYPALSATSAEQARVAICHAFGFGFKQEFASILPTGIYTIPEVSTVGETEESLQAKGVNYVAGRALYSKNPRGQIIGDSAGFLKLLFDHASMKLLGVHAIGEHATELIHIGLIALATGSGEELFNNVCFNYPTLGDLYKSATYDAMRDRMTRHQS
jgi:NAD(P) transhydrogenase